MTKLTVVVIALLLGLLVGLAHEPDSGTPVSVTGHDMAGAIVGADHAKPLPNNRSVSELLALQRVLTPTLLALALLLGLGRGWEGVVSREPEGDHDPSVRWSLRRPRRGPPALA